MRTQAYNPVLPNWEYLPDVEPRVFEGRLYLYGSHDRFGASRFCLNSYVGWSAPVEDLGDWRFEGSILDVKSDPANADGSQTGFAPDCVRGPDGRYYFYYCLNNTSKVSVAVSDRPAGPFVFCGYVQYPDGRALGDQDTVYAFDPGVLVAEDGRVWLYTGFGPTGEMREGLLRAGKEADGAYCLELEQDLRTVKSPAKLVAPYAGLAGGTGYEGHAFFEASSPRQINGRYYLIYSSQINHELCYAVSDRPDGDFCYGGTIVSIGDVGLDGNTRPVNYLGNTHGGLVRVGEQWYIFYHRQTNWSHYCRQCCAEPVTILPDGSIPQVAVTSCGLNGGPLEARGIYSAASACNLSSAQGAVGYSLKMIAYPGHPYFTQSGTDREGDGDQYIAGLTDGGWCAFKYFRFDGAEGQIFARTRGDGSGRLIVTLEKDGPAVAELPITPSAAWTQCGAPLHASRGEAALYFTYRGSGKVDFAYFTIC